MYYNVIEIKNNEMIQSFLGIIELESMAFVQEEFLNKKIQKKDVFGDLLIIC